MLPRAWILLVVIGIAAAAGQRNNQDYPYGSGNPYGNNQNNPYGNNQNNPYGNNQNNPGYDQGYNSGYNTKEPQVYTQNRTLVYCYFNGSRIQHDMRQPGNYDAPSPVSRDPDVSSCTHILFGAAMIHPSDYRVQIIDSDFASENGKFSFNNLGELRRRYPNVKIYVSISGDRRTFATMAADNNYRLRFGKNVKTFVHQYNLDGVNIDWQWPVGPGSGNDKQHYFELLTQLKSEKREMDITTFIPPGDLQIEELVPLFNYEVIEHVIVMALEMRGHHSQRIEHHAPVDSYNSGQTVNRVIHTIKKYVPEQHHYKYILAIPFYGYRYQLESRVSNRDESPMNKPFTKLTTSYREQLMLPYSLVCREIAANNYVRGYDSRNQIPWATHENIVYVYEDTESVRAKTRLAQINGFGGVMAYSVDMDDATGQCNNMRSFTNDRNSYNYGSYSDRYPLLHAIYDQAQRGNAAMFHSSPLAIVIALVCAMIFKLDN